MTIDSKASSIAGACGQKSCARSLPVVRTSLLVLSFLTLPLLGCDQPAAEQKPAEAVAPLILYGPTGNSIPPAPQAPDGPLSPEVEEAIERLLHYVPTGLPIKAIKRLGAAGDPRVLWLLTDLFSFSTREVIEAVAEAFEQLTKTELEDAGRLTMINRLIAWDLPAFPGYRENKWRLFQLIEPLWEPFFADEDAAVDWRLVGWGGVLIDERLHATPEILCLRGCIPAIDAPVVTDAAGGDWYPDERLVFGIVINGEARAYPKNMMEVHEMVNDKLGGRHISIPYCTLCGSAQAYFTDDMDGFWPVLRTSGLLFRSNKLMYDRSTWSAMDTFSGRALSGPLYDAGVVLTPVSVITSTWGAWKLEHPDTTILERLRPYPLDPLRGRDDHGPIFPIGDVDQRLGVQEKVLGVETPNGPIAFPVRQAVTALRAGERVEMGGVRLQLEGSGLRALIGNVDAAAHEAFWFAWSQFRPETRIWERVYV